MVLLWAGVARGQGQAPLVTVRPEKPTVAVGEVFGVEVSVTSNGGETEVSLPRDSAFELVRQGGVSSAFSFSTGFGRGTQMTRQETRRWEVRALRPGRQQLGPLVVQVGAQQYRVGSTTIEVVATGAGSAGGGAPGQPAGPGGLLGGGGPGAQLPGQVPMEELEGAVFDRELFVRSVVEPATAYVGQQVVFTIYLYTTLRLSDVSVTREASSDGFWSEDLLGPSRRLEFEDQYVGNQHFRVAVLRRVALFPLRTGAVTIGAPRVEARTAFRSLFSARSNTVVREGVPVEVRVRALPEKGRPAGWSAGNVGEFEISAAVDREQVKVGDPVTLTVTVRGRGLVRNVKLRPLGEVQGARMYEPRVNDAMVNDGGQLGGERRWEYLLLPQKAGPLKLPPVTLAYFDPAAQAYREKQTEGLVVTVTGGAAGSQGDGAVGPGPAGEERGEATPLHSIRRDAALARGHQAVVSRWWFWAFLGLAPGLWLVVVVTQTVHRRRLATAPQLEARRAGTVARRRLRAVAQGGEGGAGEVVRGVNEFFAKRFGRGLSGMTMEEIRTFVQECGASAEVARQVVALHERCERSRFSGGGEDGAVVKALADEALELLEALEGLRSNGGTR